MAQFKDLLVTGPVRIIGDVNFNKLPKYNNINLATANDISNVATSVMNLDNSKVNKSTLNFNGNAYNIIVQSADNTTNQFTHRAKNEFIQDLGLSQVYNYKGTITWAQLKQISSAKIGDVYSISDADFYGNTNADWACYNTVTTATGANYLSYWQSLGGKVDLSGYLPRSGGDMGGTAVITWPDSGNWGNSNNGVTFPIKRGGLKWIGQSDQIELFSEESASDMLNLVAQFGDDSSSGIKVRNHSGTDVISLMANGNVYATTFTGNLSGNATSATKATQDGDGNVIKDTYLKLAGGTMTGPLHFANGPSGIWNIVGDDSMFGDQNVAGAFCIKGNNGATTLRMYSYDTNVKTTANLQYNTSDKCIDVLFN